MQLSAKELPQLPSLSNLVLRQWFDGGWGRELGLVKLNHY